MGFCIPNSGKFWSFPLGHFIKHNFIISVELKPGATLEGERGGRWLPQVSRIYLIGFLKKSVLVDTY